MRLSEKNQDNKLKIGLKYAISSNFTPIYGGVFYAHYRELFYAAK